MKTNKKRKKKYTRVDGVLYEAITSNYDGRVIGWTTVHENNGKQEITNIKTTTQWKTKTSAFSPLASKMESQLREKPPMKQWIFF